MNAARAEHRAVAPQRRRAAPEVPIQPRLRRFFRQVARAAGIAEAAFDLLNLADHAVAHQFARHAKFLHGALHGAGLQDAFVGRHGLENFDGFVDVVRQRLLAIDILAGAQRGECRNGVPVVGRGDADGVDVLAGDEIAEIVESRAIACS